MQCNRSTPAVVRCVSGVDGSVWVDKQRVIHHSHTAPKLSSLDGYRFGTTPSQYRIIPTQQNRVVLATTDTPNMSPEDSRLSCFKTIDRNLSLSMFSQVNISVLSK